MSGDAADLEGLEVLLHRRAVEADGAVEGAAGERHQALLPGEAQHHHVGVDGVAQPALGHGHGGDGVVVAAGAGQPPGHRSGVEPHVPVGDEVGGGLEVAVADRVGAVLGVEGQGFGPGGHQQVAGDQDVGAGGGDAAADGGILGLADAHVAEHRAALLRQAGHVDDRGGVTVDVRGHAQDRGGGGDPGAADAGEDDVLHPLEGLDFRQRRGVGGEGRHGRGLGVLRPFERDEGGAEAVQAGIVLIAGGLVDLALAAELGLQRLDGDAVAGGRAVAAALTDQGVDEHAPVGLGHGPALAAAALFGGADLVVDQDADAGDLAQLLLDLDQVRARTDDHAWREVGDALVAFRLGGDDDGALNALGGELAGDLGDGEAALGRLAAGHGDGVVVEQLVGDVRTHGDGAADRQGAGVAVGAIAQVDEDVLLLGEGTGAGPAQTLPAHVAGQVGLRVGEAGHVVAADARQGARALRQAGRGVVRAACAEIGLADLVRPQADGRDAGGGDAVEIGVHPFHVRAGRQAVGDGQGDFGHRKRAEIGKQRMAVLVHLADHPGLGVGGQVVEGGAGLGFQQRALVLHHHQRLQAAGEGAKTGGLQRPGHADLVEGHAEAGGLVQAEAHGRQRLKHVLPGLAMGGDAQARARGGQHRPVQPVGLGEGQGRRDLEEAQPPLLVHGLVLEPDAKTARRHGEALRNDQLVAIQGHVDRGPRVHHVRQGDQTNPQA